MVENRREHERVSVNLYVECKEPCHGPPRILNMSSSGFLLRGDLLAGEGGILHVAFKIRTASGEMRISTHGTVVRSRIVDDENEYGIRIEEFGSLAEEAAYKAYALALMLGICS